MKTGKTIWDDDGAARTAVRSVAQVEYADALMRLSSAVTWWAVGCREYLNELLEEARVGGRDFTSLVAARYLGIDYCDVLPDERWAAKHGLFAYWYVPSKDAVWRSLGGDAQGPMFCFRCAGSAAPCDYHRAVSKPATQHIKRETR